MAWWESKVIPTLFERLLVVTCHNNSANTGGIQWMTYFIVKFTIWLNLEIIRFLPAAGRYLNPKLQLNVNEMLWNNDGVVLKPFFNILEKSYFCIFGKKPSCHRVEELLKWNFLMQMTVRVSSIHAFHTKLFESIYWPEMDWKPTMDHSFSTYGKSSEKITFVTSWYAHLNIRIGVRNYYDKLLW